MQNCVLFSEDLVVEGEQSKLMMLQCLGSMSESG